jgi:hypothetical protein
LSDFPSVELPFAAAMAGMPNAMAAAPAEMVCSAPFLFMSTAVKCLKIHYTH